LLRLPHYLAELRFGILQTPAIAWLHPDRLAPVLGRDLARHPR
jgi:hypothetical protein